MARRALQTASPQDRLLPAALAILVVVSFLPAGWLGPATWFGDLLATLAAPISQPMRVVGGWLAPAGGGAAEPEAIARLKNQVEHFKMLYEQMRERNEDLLKQMEQLRVMVELNPNVSTRLLPRPVIGGTSDPASALLQIRGGSSEGIRRNDVVAVGGVQLLGRVRNAGLQTSWILPITAEDSGYIEGKVMVGAGEGYTCKLRPDGEGSLTGDVADPGLGGGPAIEAGQVVRLLDKGWPASAQMLVIGTVESVAPAPDSPLRPVIVVRPTVALERVTEVVVRISGEGED